jgi:hypothetical protein
MIKDVASIVPERLLFERGDLPTIAKGCLP